MTAFNRYNVKLLQNALKKKQYVMMAIYDEKKRRKWNFKTVTVNNIPEIPLL